MEYRDNQEIHLGDIVEVGMPTGIEIARVVMLGENYEHMKLEKSFEDWVNSDKILDHESIVLEWVHTNPLEHNNPKYAPVGNYMFTGISSDLKLKKRAPNETET